MSRPTLTLDDSLTVPEKTTYVWESTPNFTRAKARHILHDRINHTAGQAKETYMLALETLDKAWSKHGFSHISSNKLKNILTAAAKHVGWYDGHIPPKNNRPAQPSDPTLRTCTACKQTKPKAQFTRKPSKNRAIAYGWKPETSIEITHPKCNLCASIKRKNIATKRSTPTVARLRREISNKMQIVRKMEDSEYRERKYELLIECRTRLENYLIRGVRAPDAWHMMLTKEERSELEALYHRVVWPRRKPEVF
jgi:hypothetical protein